MTDCVLFRLLPTPAPAAPPDRRRWWVLVGGWLRLTDDVALRLLRERPWGEDDYLLQIELHGPGGCQVYLLRDGDGLDLSGLAGARVVPRALRMADGRPQAALLEVVRTDVMAHWALS